MKYTNKGGISNAVAKAVIAASEEYDSEGWRSITGLIDSPRAQLLKQRHSEKITEDVSDLIWAFFGNMAHLIAERYAGKDVMAEQRWVHRFLEKEISFKPDRVEKNIGSVPITWTLRDFKITSVWVLKFALQGSLKREWVAQLNMYAFLLGELGFNVSNLKLEIIARDWRMGESIQSPHDYPQNQIGVFDVPLWTKDEQRRYLEERINLFLECEKLADDDLPFCTNDERWADPDRWAVVRKSAKKSKESGYKKAVPGGSSFDSHGEAMRFIASKGVPRKPASENPKPETLEKLKKEALERMNELEVEYRKSESKRCERGYCKAAPFCNQFRTEVKPVF